MNPRLLIDLAGLRHNIEALCERCHALGIGVAAVTKSFCADRRMVEVFADSPADYLADSRLENIERYPPHNKKTMLLRLPTPSEAMRTVRSCDISLNSEMATLEQLAQAAEAIGRRHGVVLMVDMGDLREGIYYDNFESISATVEYIMSRKSLEMLGFGINLTCYGSVIPTQDNLRRFCEVTARVEERFGALFPIISGGNSSSLYLVENGSIPAGITNLRLGESIIRGVETAYQKPIPWLRQDIITLEAEIIERQRKPSYPEGETAYNAFGEQVSYVDHGRRERAITAIGRQDTDFENLVCIDSGVSIVGASSDHLIVDVTDAESPCLVGDTLRFQQSYSAILYAFTSPYVERVYLD